MYTIEIEYELTPENRIQSINEYFWIVAGKVYLIIFPILIACGIFLSFSDYSLHFNVLGWVGMIFPFFMTIVFLKNYLYTRKIVLQEFDLIPNGKMLAKATLDQKSITIDRGTSKNQAAWSNITRMRISNNYLYLMHKRMPVASMPLSVLTEEHLIFIRDMIGMK